MQQKYLCELMLRDQLRVLHVCCVSWLWCELETNDTYIYVGFYFKEVCCIGSAMRREFASCVSFICSLEADVCKVL